MKKLSWRLSKLPTPSELTELVVNKIITQEEAKQILVGEVEDRDTDSLKEEIKFLRALVEKLSNSRSTRIIETIREIERPWRTYPWYAPYYIWTGALTTGSVGTGTASFTDIATF